MKNKNLIILSVIVLLVSFLIGFSMTTIVNKSESPQLGTIYIMPSELGSAIELKEGTGANVVVIGMLGETTENMIQKGNVQDIVNSEDLI